MATFVVSSRVSSFSYCSTRSTAATINVPKIQVAKTVSTSRLPTRGLVAELDYLNNFTPPTTTTTNHVKQDLYYSSTNSAPRRAGTHKPSMEVVKLHLIMEVVAERIEMHNNVGVQRDNWNHLLLTSVNMITLSAVTMVGLAATASSSGASIVALKVSSMILFMAATGLLAVMNKIQPSQLAEEQRNASRLFKKLHGELETKVALGNPNEGDVNEAMERVLALDKAYPLPLLGNMLDKFPQRLEPAVWWPRRNSNKQRCQRQEEEEEEEGLCGKLVKVRGKNNNNNNNSKNNNGWDAGLEGEMKAIVKALRKKDMAEYFRLGDKVLSVNKVLAVSGPILSGLAAFGCACLGCVNASWPVMLGVICGALASVVNTLEHGCQVGMVFELYRATTGFFKQMEESIEQNVNEQDPHSREHGELFQIRVALQLGRSVSELRQLATAFSASDEDFASKLF